MGLEYCQKCERVIDLDEDVEHFEKHQLEEDGTGNER